MIDSRGGKVDLGLKSFNALSRAQKNAMNHVAFNGFATNIIPSEKTLLTLVAKGYMNYVDQRVSVPKLGFMTVKIPLMPIAVHAAWCAYVAKDTGE